MADIKIDPSVLQERSDSYSSLTDIHGADVFTTVHEKKVEAYKNENKQAYEDVQEKLFVQSEVVEVDSYEKVKGQLFTDNKSYLIQQTDVAQSSVMEELMLPITVTACVIVLVILINYAGKRKRRRKQHEADTYAYES